jgi:hypothetical protein
MRRRDFFKATGVAVAAFALRAVAQDEPDDEPGAVKVDLFEVTDAGIGDKAGWVIANTTASGQLIIVVHLDRGDALTYFDVHVTVNGEERPEDVGELITNDQGKGNAHLSLPIAEYPENDDEPDILNVTVDLWWAVDDRG